MAKRKVLRHKTTGVIFGWNAAMARNPKVEEAWLDLNKPQSKPDSTPDAPAKKAVKKKAAKAPTKPMVADSAEELDELLAGIETDGEDG